jgi:hypothetical protein
MKEKRGEKNNTYVHTLYDTYVHTLIGHGFPCPCGPVENDDRVRSDDLRDSEDPDVRIFDHC